MDHTELDNISLIILVDNIATASVINKGVCIFDKKVDEAIKLLRKRAAKRGIILKAIYIPGGKQPADEPSRGDPICQAKCSVALLYALERLGSKFESLYFESHLYKKRPRE